MDAGPQENFARHSSVPYLCVSGWQREEWGRQPTERKLELCWTGLPVVDSGGELEAGEGKRDGETREEKEAGEESSRKEGRNVDLGSPVAAICNILGDRALEGEPGSGEGSYE
ncbi:hypothetical protein R1flu_024425 [Riccia fluitans]|uniref:Uncharacterized protein n=1 Tax=Riccia fluitans TaxID=41844 RepID=A0ABD1XYZ4_9MARC